MELLWILLAIPAVIGIGYVADSLRILTPRRRRIVNGFAYYVALPALLFVSTAERAFGEIVSSALILGVLLTFGGTIALAWFVHGRADDPSTRGVAIVGDPLRRRVGPLRTNVRLVQLRLVFKRCARLQRGHLVLPL